MDEGRWPRFQPQELVAAGFQEGSSVPRPVDHDFTQGLQHLSFVVVEVTVDLTDTLLFHHPQLAVGFCDEARIVADNDHSFGGRRMNQERESQVERSPAHYGGPSVPALTPLVLVDGLPQRIDGLDVQVVGRFILWRRKRSVAEHRSR